MEKIVKYKSNKGVIHEDKKACLHEEFETLYKELKKEVYETSNKVAIVKLGYLAAMYLKDDSDKKEIEEFKKDVSDEFKDILMKEYLHNFFENIFDKK